MCVPQQNCWLLTADISSEPLDLSQDSYTINHNHHNAEFHTWTLSPANTIRNWCQWINLQKYHNQPTG